MTPNIIIHKASDATTRMVAHVDTGSKRYFMLMEHDYITLKFSDATPTLLHLGDYVEIEVGTGKDRYEITAPTKGEYNKTTGGYDYDIRLDAQYWKFKNKLFKFLPQIGSNETSWTYTDTIENHAKQVIANLRAQAYKRNDDGSETLVPERATFLYNGMTEEQEDGTRAGDWEIEWDETVDATKAVTIQYDKLNIIDAIAAIAEAYECEWWFEHKVLHFGKCQFGETPVKLEMGKELVAISPSASKETYATRLYIYGSDKNIASNYRKDLIFDATVDSGKLHDPARELEIGWFRPELIGTKKAKAAQQLTLDFAPISNSEKKIEYRQSGQQGAATHLFKPDGHTGDDYAFDMEGEKNSIQEGMFEWSWLPVERPYLILSTLKFSLTPTELIKVTDAIAPTHLQASFKFIVDYYEEDGKTKRSFYHPVTAKAAWKGLNVAHTFKFDDAYLPVPTEKIAKVTIEDASQIDLAVCYDDKTAGNYGYVYDNKPAIKVAINAAGQIGIFNGWPEFSATGIKIEVLDKATGDVEQTIEGATFNEAFDTGQRKLTLPEGKTIEAGAKYQLPQLNKALVPAHYFTSIYTVFEKYQDVTTNGIVNSRLLLPTHDEDGNPLKGYIDVFNFDSEEEAVEDVVVFEDVCPSRTSKITKLARSGDYTDGENEQDGSTTETAWKAWRFQDDLFNDSNPFDINNYGIDKDLKITFQSGLLNGMTFGVSYDTEDNFFEILRDETTKLPNEIIKPKVGDEFILHGFNIAMLSDSNTDYIAKAEQELLSKGREYAKKLNTDANTYHCTVACDTAYAAEETTPDSLFLEPGRTVNLIHPAYFANGRISRVLGYEIPLDFAYDNPVYIIGEKATYSRIGAIEDKLDNIGNQTGNFSAMLGGGGASSAGGSGANVQIIGRGDETTPSDRNVYSSLRARVEFALKTAAQTISHLWSFLKGIRIGSFVKGMSGAEIDAAGNAEVESLHVRSWLKVQELIYNRLNAQEGDTSFADVGTIEHLTDNEDGTQAAYMRMRWDGDFTAFQPGDIVYGYVNNLSRADAKEFYKAWAWVKSVNREDNQIILVAYPDSETPAGTNHPMTEGMTITRWGNNIEPTLQTYINPVYSAVISKRGDTYINTRQRSFFISCDNGNLVELMGVNKPKLEAGNYGTILGIIPDGLLDEKTAELVNKDQPYLFARGIIVQDLIRVGYEGVQTRIANYRGLWSQATASSTTDYYRCTPGMYDTVTWNGSLWQCVASNSTAQPSVSNSSWVKMTASPDDGKEVRVWLLNPSANIVSVRQDEVIPEVLTCEVTLCSSNNATQSFDNNYDLLNAGAKLYYSSDGLNFEEFLIGTTEPLELEDGSGVIEMEDSEDDSSVLTVGGNDIPTSEIGDRIIFSLRDATTGDELARTHVPVVKDGIDGTNGIDGRDGLMVYPAGTFDPNTTYSATSETAPVVMYAENYYVLRRGATYKGANQSEDRNTPAKEVANAPVQNGASTSRWQLFDKFNAIFADIIMAEFAKLASAVFYGDWMISQQGTITYTKTHLYKVGATAPNMTDTEKTLDNPAGWSSIFPTNVPDGSSIYYIFAYKNPDGALGFGETWSTPATTTSAIDNSAYTINDSQKYQDFKHGGFQPNYSVNFKTGEINAGSGVFKGEIRTELKNLSDSDAINVGEATINSNAEIRYRLQGDLKLVVGEAEIELPTSINYIGAEVTLCENAGAYSRSSDCVAVVAQDGGYIGGIAAENAESTEFVKQSTIVRFINGVVRFLGTPKLSAGKPVGTKWMIISGSASTIYGRQ